MFFKFILTAIGAYLLGSFNFGIIISKLLTGSDLRNFGSGNAGFTNAYRVMGPKKAILVMTGDVLKGILAILLGRWLGGDDGKLIAFIFVIVGHVFPLYFGFRGGKGVLTTISVLLMFDWRVFLILMAVFLITFALSRYISLSSMLAAATLPFAMLLFYSDRWYFVAVGALIGGAIIFFHRSNI
jgi:glycerol-3-phosphate acyltransferase PlsY